MNIRKLLLPVLPAMALCFPLPSFSAGTELDINRMSLPDAVTLLWTEVLKTPFMLAPELVSDPRAVTLHISPDIDEREFITRYLGNMNIRISRKKGVDYIYSHTPAAPEEPLKSLVYTPRYRTVEYLHQALSGLGQLPAAQQPVQGANGEQTWQAVSSGTRFISASGDVFVFRGTAREVELVRQLLPQIDVRAQEVSVAGYVFEVQTSERNGSGLALAAELLSGRFSITMSSASGLDNFIRLSTGSVDAMYELFRTDSRFQVVSSPRLRVISGKEAVFSVGSDVPVLSSVSWQDKVPVQSVEYRSSGAIFRVKPTVTQDVIGLDIVQQLSNFAKTDTGVNNTPTLIKREVSTSVSLSDGDIIVLGGLAENKTSKARTGLSFLPDVFGSDSDERAKTDIIVVLQARRV
ncbi:type II secretion system protein GspD [Escherichia coli]|uniref:type II secretion system protein GspD n=1 Tax=Escherichia coli TaxID=562 RepID=UPI000F0B0815|nr:type II secretion system protein GspD [Escherichia coli]EFF0757002.1 type II secretion system protein GspD [Escherichia coli]EHM0390776.1 type II secretion system protein GspD [Escherichia coli]EJH1088854.1 type II secretion system protein GspD [Escherichia coli]